MEFSLNNPLYHVLIPVLLALSMNSIIYIFGINKISEQKDKQKDTQKDKQNSEYFKLFPPGYVIGIIWTIIFGLLGYAHYLMYKLKDRINIGSVSIVLVIIFCLLYPVITSLKFTYGLLLNLITLIISFVLGFIIILESKYIFLYIIPLIVWASYVNVVDTLICSDKV
jgi:tryptophan-rich sensory protein